MSPRRSHQIKMAGRSVLWDVGLWGLVWLGIFGMLLLWILESYRCQGQIPHDHLYYYSTPPLQHLYNWWCQRNSVGPQEVFPHLDQYFPRHSSLQDRWKEIRKEAIWLYTHQRTRPIKHDLFFDQIADDKWNRFYLKWYGPCLPDARQLCPVTCSLLDRLPEVHLAMFSILNPGAKIRPHHGPFKGCLRYHLGLVTPKLPSCSIHLDGQPYIWEDGKEILFDDTYHHYVQNNTTQLRIVLFCDVERTMSSAFATSINRWVCHTYGPPTTRTNYAQEQVED